MFLSIYLNRLVLWYGRSPRSFHRVYEAVLPRNIKLIYGGGKRQTIRRPRPPRNMLATVPSNYELAEHIVLEINRRAAAAINNCIAAVTDATTALWTRAVTEVRFFF